VAHTTLLAELLMTTYFVIVETRHGYRPHNLRQDVNALETRGARTSDSSPNIFSLHLSQTDRLGEGGAS
jgi:hypothetical protein